MIRFDRENVILEGTFAERSAIFPHTGNTPPALQHLLDKGGKATWQLIWSTIHKKLDVLLHLKLEKQTYIVTGNATVHSMVQEVTVLSQLNVTAGVDDLHVMQAIKILEGRDPYTYLRDFIAVSLPQNNPLPFLRKSYPGEWVYIRGVSGDEDCITWNGVVVWSQGETGKQPELARN